MGKYSHDMRKETAPKVCLPIGWRRFKIDGGEEMTSKKGNPMFKFTFYDLMTQTNHEVYAVSTEGKRWFLKMVLGACNCPASENGVYDWDMIDIVNQIVQGRIEHEPNDWIDRSGTAHNDKQSKVVEVRGDNGSIPAEPSSDRSDIE